MKRILLPAAAAAAIFVLGYFLFNMLGKIMFDYIGRAVIPPEYAAEQAKLKGESSDLAIVISLTLTVFAMMAIHRAHRDK